MAGMGSGMGESVTIDFNSNNSGLVTGVEGSAESLNLLQDAFDLLAKMASTVTESMSLVVDSLATITGAAGDTASALAMFGSGLSDATVMTEEYTSAADTAAASTATFAGAMGGGGGGAFLGGGGGGRGGGSGGGGLLGVMGDFKDSITGALSPMTDFISRSADIVAGIAAWSIIQQAISWVQQLSNELFNLNVTTEKTVNGWSYIFGGGHQNKQVAAQLMNWTSQYSMDIPFTRQDLMTATTVLGSAGLNPKQLEQFMPYLSDLASTYGTAAYGGHGVTLHQAANAVRMGTMGQSRLLKYDLNINPEELVKYGLVGRGTSMGFHISDPNSLYRALENFAIAHGVSTANGDQGGAAKEMANSTWWGGFSSATDRLQNTLLAIGGTNLDGSIRKGSLFSNLKNDLFSLMDWFDKNQALISKFADTLSRLVGTVVEAGGGALGQFFEWIGKIAPLQDTMSWMNDLSTNILNLFGVQQPGTPFDPTQFAGHLHDQLTHPKVNDAGTKTVSQVQHDHWRPDRSAAPLGGEDQPPAPPKGMDWNDMPVIGGIIQAFNATVGQINWGPLGKSFSDLGKGFSDLWAGISVSVGPFMASWLKAFGEIMLSLINLGLQGFAQGIEMVARGMSDLGQILKWAEPFFDPLNKAMDHFTTILTNLLTALNHGDWKHALDILGQIFGFVNGGGNAPNRNNSQYHNSGQIAPGTRSPFGGQGH